MDRGRLLRRLWRLPVLRRLEVRRVIWKAVNAMVAARRWAFERMGSDRYSRPALFDMETRLVEYLPRTGGYFVEAGGYDGFIQSNTYWLERFRGWDGVLVEPIPHLYEQASSRRRAQVFNYALVPPDWRDETVSLRYGGLMSLVSGAQGGGADEAAHVSSGDMNGLDDVYEVEAPAKTLSDVLDEAKAPESFDLLVLDVEGYEAEVLRGLDFDRFKPAYLLVEVGESSARLERVDKATSSHYERIERLSPADVLYRRSGAAGP